MTAEILLRNLLGLWLLPPGINIALFILAAVLSVRWRKLALGLMVTSLLTLYLTSLPWVANTLRQSLETYPPLDLNQLTGDHADAIVLLGGGRYYAAPEYQGDTPSDAALVRARYAMHLYRHSQLPVVVSGGRVWKQSGPSEAQLLQTALAEWGVPVTLLEEHSSNTQGNAAQVAAMLKQTGRKRILLVTHAWHMRRAVALFSDYELEIIAAPTGFTTARPYGSKWLQITPDSRSLRISAVALREYLGIIWHRITND